MRGWSWSIEKKYVLPKHLILAKETLSILWEKDLKALKITNEEVTVMSKTQLKATFKKNAKSAAFKQIKTTLLTHTKVRSISYDHLEMQKKLEK